jgi:hypothetical protein
MGATSTTTQKMDPWAPSQPGLTQGINDASALYNAGGFNVSPYGGPMVAGYNQMRTDADAATMAAAQNATQMGQAGQDALTRAMDPSMRSDAWGQIRQNTIDAIMPGINSSFAGSGMTGSGLHASALASGLSRGLADVENNAWQQGENRALSATGMLPSMAGMQFGAADALRAAGGDRQAYDQSVINSEMLRDQQSKMSGMNAIQDYMALMSGVGSTFGVQRATQSQSPGLLGMLGFGLQAAPLMFSDARIKENIKRVGRTDDGEGVYTYRYKGDPTPRMGVMAQEVAATKPHAVHNVGGLLAVDYGAL